MAAVLGGCADRADSGGDAATPAGDAAPAPGEPAPASAVETATVDATPSPADGASLQDANGDPVPVLPFDIDSIPTSSAPLGALPFFSLPAGYAAVNRPQQRAHARFPFRLGNGVHWVEGASWNSLVGADRGTDGKSYSALELRRNLEAVLGQAGATQVYSGPLQRDLYYGPQIEAEIGGGFIEGVNLDGDTPTTVHVIRQADRNIWVQLSTQSNLAALVVVAEQPFVATATWSDTFPYLSMPAGYDKGNRPEQRDFDMYPFWTGSSFERVEGKVHAAAVSSDRDTYSMHEVRRNLEAMMADAGGTRVFEGTIADAPPEDVTFDQSFYSDATGYGWDDYTSLVYRVDLADGRQVWVHVRLDYKSAGWVVAEREGFVQTAALLPARAMKHKLDADGRVALQVNFATDKSDILPDSLPQVAQVVALLRDDPALRLSVDGHTDASGDAARNRALSDSRAQSVVAALVEAGIAADRLRARGHGADRPVADNATDQGKARNRRVELVKL